jgi:hypothetical protein
MRLAKMALLATAGAVASGGIALASAQSGLQPPDPGRVLPSNAAPQAQQHAADALAGHPSGKPADKTAKTHAPHGTPNPNLNGLCHAWLAGAGSEHGNARSNPAFSVLVATAGGSEAVDGYCTDLIGSKTHPSDDPSEAPEPEDSDAPESPEHPGKTSHPGNTVHPGKTSHPVGRPSDVPPVTTHP